MKVMTVLGTRPEIIRLSQIIGRLDQLCDHVLVHTGQNFDPTLSDIFFQQLGIRPPNHYLGIRGDTVGEQIGKIIAASEQILLSEKPDRLLVLGDTNSALVTIIAKRLGIPVFHMEAGNRCFDDRVPEEVNRRIVDHCSDILMPYTERSRANLLDEGIPSQNIYVIGNPIYEVIRHYEANIQASSILSQLNLQPGQYFLVTMHRAENVDIEARLRSFIDSFELLASEYKLPLICSLHPRTKQRMESYNIHSDVKDIRFVEPFGFFDFIALERQAFCVISDSGTVQEECCIFKSANVTIRDVTERPETIECGSNILSGASATSILRSVQVVLNGRCDWKQPPEYMVENVSSTVARIVLGYLNQLRN